jgi:hypothetical protein
MVSQEGRKRKSNRREGSIRHSAEMPLRLGRQLDSGKEWRRSAETPLRSVAALHNADF